MLVLAICYALCCGAAALGLSVLRDKIVASESSPQGIEQWRQWKAEGERLARQGVRRPVKSDRPPALVLMTDYYRSVVSSVLAIITGFFLFLVLVLWSRLRTPEEGDRFKAHGSRSARSELE